MQVCAGISIIAENVKSYKAVVKCVEEFFSDPNHRTPEYFDEWISEMNKDEEEMKIEVNSDVQAYPEEYEPLFDELAHYLVDNLQGMLFFGKFDLYNDDFGYKHIYFTFDGETMNVEIDDEAHDGEMEEMLYNYIEDVYEGDFEGIIEKAMSNLSHEQINAIYDIYAEIISDEFGDDIYEEYGHEPGNVSLEDAVEMIIQCSNTYEEEGIEIFDGLRGLFSGLVEISTDVEAPIELPDGIKEFL